MPPLPASLVYASPNNLSGLSSLNIRRVQNLSLLLRYNLYMTKWSGPIVVVLIFGIFILDVKIGKIDCAQAGRNSSGPGGAALGHPLDQALDLLYSLSWTSCWTCWTCWTRTCCCFTCSTSSPADPKLMLVFKPAQQQCGAKLLKSSTLQITVFSLTTSFTSSDLILIH